jgi:hypothetical protein
MSLKITIFLTEIQLHIQNDTLQPQKTLCKMLLDSEMQDDFHAELTTFAQQFSTQISELLLDL